MYSVQIRAGFYIACRQLPEIFSCHVSMTLLFLPLKESNGSTDSYAAISQVDRLQSEPESIRKWREEQKERLEQLGKKGVYCTSVLACE